MFLPTPFASKELPDGKKLYRRKRGYSFPVTMGANVYKITVPYAVAKVNEIEIIGCPHVVQADLKVLDSVSGTYTTFPNYVLNQFAYEVNIAKDRFEDISAYDAELRSGMQIELTINSVPITAFTCYVNVVFHEVV